LKPSFTADELLTFHLTAALPVLAFARSVLASGQGSTATIGEGNHERSPVSRRSYRAVSSKGVVAAGAYVDGRRVANIAVDEASSWRSRPGHVVWIGL
jgi:hypothetical protein